MNAASILSAALLVFSLLSGVQPAFAGQEDWVTIEEDPAPLGLTNALSQDSDNVRAALSKLSGVENLEITYVPGGAILRGELLSTEALHLAGTVSASHSGVINLCTLHPDALKSAAALVHELMAEMGIVGLVVKIVGRNLLLTGTPASPADVEKVRDVCLTYHIPLRDGTSRRSSDPRMVLFEVSFTEINRQTFQSLGVIWPASYTLSDPSGARLSRITPSQSLEMTLNILAERGRARILSKPRLTCRSGDNATFMAGGEIPIPKTDGEGRQTVSWKRYGIILDVAPQVEAGGRIFAHVTSEVSTVDRANAVEGIPGVLTRRISTSLSLFDGQTIVLSGLVNTDDSQRIRKVPLFGDLPVLGELFRSRDFQKRETELVVFLTPQIAGGKMSAVDGRIDPAEANAFRVFRRQK